MMLASTILTRMLPRRRAHRRSLAGLVAAAAAAAIVVVSPSPASASGDNILDVCDFSNYSCQTGTPSSAPAADKCAFADSSYGGTMVCVAYTGDKVYVWDGKSDGNAALGEIVDLDAPSSNVQYRYCLNPGQYQSWAVCNFDWSESHEKGVYGGIRVTHYSLSMQPLWWFSNN